MKNATPTPYCPACDHKITEAEVNIAEGFALCAKCGLLSKLSKLDFLHGTSQRTSEATPKRVSMIADRERVKISISLFSPLRLIGAIFVTLFWNGIVSLFLSLAVAAVAYNTIGYVPDWLPVPGLEDGKPIMNGEVMGEGITLFFCLFLLPFVVIGSGLLINTALRMFGTTTVIIDKNKSSVSTGISFLRLGKSFDPHKVKSIDLTVNKLNENQPCYQIEMELEGRKNIKFGRALTENQQEWLAATLRQIFIYKRPSSRNPEVPSLF